MRCTTCHREIRELVTQKRSYHGRVFNRAKGDIDCARCHTEHYGENFSIIRWPTSRDDFDHKETGYPLAGRHAGLKCEQCHNPRHIPAPERKLIVAKDLTKTYEGLSPACLTCHEDRHKGQLGTECQRCHAVSGWKLPSFDHSTTHYPLTGRHERVACDKCHRPLPDDPKVIQYVKLNFAECSGCHQDPHHGAFAARCGSCHNTESWKQVQLTTSTFNHDKTKFPLAGKHADLACLKCHKDSNFKTAIAHEKCMDCHKEQHKGQFDHRTDHGECGPCHTEKGWRPTTFSEADHRSTEYPVSGKHQGVPCAKCHLPAGLDTNYHPAFKACLDCHKDPHGGQFAHDPIRNRCEDCHTVDGFRPSTFTLSRHQSSAFVLKGAHQAVACGDCHHDETAQHTGRDMQFHFGDMTCQGCHKDPHRGDFPKVLQAALTAGQDQCENCHALHSWRELKPFDHATTGYRLAGAHAVLACTDCHRPLRSEPGPARTVPFKGAPETCVGCHEDIHAGQFERVGQPADCARCHNSSHWAASQFDHNKGTDFALTGAHDRVPCKQCHNQHREFNGRSIVVYKGTPRACTACHRK